METTHLTERIERPQVLAVARVLSRVYVVLTVLGTLYLLATVLLSTGPIPIRLPVQQFWPQIPEGVEVLDGPTAQVTGGGFTHAEVDVLGLGWDVRVWLAAGYLTQGLVSAAIAAAVYRLSVRFDRWGSFQPCLTKAVRLAGIAVMVGGLVWQICFSIAGSMASQQTLVYTAWGGPREASPTINGPINDGPIGVGAAPDFSIDFWPILVGIALLAASAALRYGEKLERANTSLPA